MKDPGLGERPPCEESGLLEKIHEPIFIVSRSGILFDINEAGRKFLRVAHLTHKDLVDFFASKLKTLFEGTSSAARIPFGKGRWVACCRPRGDVMIIEILRRVRIDS